MRCGFQDVVRTTLLKSSREKPELVCKLPGGERMRTSPGRGQVNVKGEKVRW